MAQQLFFTRDTELHAKIGNEVWRIPVLDGFSFAQATNASEVTLQEMESNVGVSRRGKRKFNDSLAPAEWSFSMYTRPFTSSGTGTGGAVSDTVQTRAVEEVMWALFAGQAQRSGFDWVDDATLSNPNEYFTWSSDNKTLTIDFSSSNKSTLGTASMIFTVGDGTVTKKYYEITEAAVNEATIDFDIDGIATIQFSGFGAVIQETTDPTAGSGVTVFNESVVSTSNFIRNRLTTLIVNPDNSAYNSGDLADTYDITLTGGSITFSNNITYIVPEELGIVNYPIGHVTGTRSVSGNFTAYLVFDNTATDKSADLWEDISALTDVVTHKFDLTFQVGGASGSPRLSVNIPQATIEIPTHSVEDLISIDTTFDGLPSTIDATDEATIQYYVA